MAKAKILIVEDEALIARATANTLKYFDYEITAIVSTGPEAIKKAKETRPNLVLMDISLKGEMDGIEAAKSIIKQLDIPVVYVTAYPDELVFERAKKTLPHGYLIKPYEERQLCDTIELALHKHNAEKEYRSFFENNRDANYMTDKSGEIIKVNSSFCELFGYTPNEIIEINVLELYDNPAEKANFIAKVEQKGHVQNHEVKLHKKDGTLVDCLISASARLDDEGKIICYQGMIHDITAQKQAAKALEESETRYRKLFDASPDGIILADSNTMKFAYANVAMCKALGYTKEELVGLGVMDIHPKESLEHVISEFEAQAKGEKTLTNDIPCLRKDGTIMYADVNTAVLLESGKPYALGFFRDITERKALEERLKQSEAEYREMFEKAVVGIFRTTLAGKLIKANPEMVRIIGYDSLEELMASKINREEMDYVDPSRRSEFKKLLDEQGFINDFEYQVHRKGGSMIWLSENSRAVRDEAGKIVCYEGFVEDVTERKSLEEQLRFAAFTDELTGLYNRKAFFRLGESGISLAKRMGKNVYLLYVDLDDLKAINDTYGHEKGDEALKGVASVLKKTFRKEDIAARIGGDEFAILAMETASGSGEGSVNIITARLHENMQAQKLEQNLPYKFSVSVGAVRYDPSVPAPFNHWLAKADDQMYAAKQMKKGKNNLDRRE